MFEIRPSFTIHIDGKSLSGNVDGLWSRRQTLDSRMLNVPSCQSHVTLCTCFRLSKDFEDINHELCIKCSGRQDRWSGRTPDADSVNNSGGDQSAAGPSTKRGHAMDLAYWKTLVGLGKKP